MVNGINFAAGTDPMTKQQDDPLENLTLIRDVPTTMGDYLVTYKKDSLGHEAVSYTHLDVYKRQLHPHPQ